MEQGAKSMERTDGGADASDFPTSSLPPPSDGRRFRALARREPLLALAVAGLFALAVETAQKPEDASEPLTSGAILPVQSTLLEAPCSVLPAPCSYPVGEAALARLLYAEPSVTNRWDAHAQRVLDTYGDTDGDGLADAEETTGLALLDAEDGQSLHAFGPDARVLRFPTAADHDCRLLPLPFAFPLGEHDFTNVYVHVDGVLGFGHPGLPEQPAAPPFAVRVPPGHPATWLAPYWADLALGTALDPGRGRVWTLPLADPATGATNGCVVAWEGLRVGTNAASSASFQAELRADGLVRILHGTFEGVEDPGALAVVGVWSAGGGWAYSAFGSGLVVPGRALRLWTTAQSDPYLRTWYKDTFDPADPDTDGDGTPDGVEWFFSVPRADGRAMSTFDLRPDPLDFDNDGLANRREYDLGLDALWYDTDGDGLPDGWEYDHGLDPLSATGADGASGDPDSDGRDNVDEFRHQTLPKEADAPPPVPEDAVWVTLELEADDFWDAFFGTDDSPRLLTLRGVGPESGRVYALHDHAGPAAWTVPLAQGSEYLLETTAYAPWRFGWDALRYSTRVALDAGDGGYVALFDAGAHVDEAADAAGSAFRDGPPPRGMPPGAPPAASLVAVCRGQIALQGGNGRDVLLDPGCTSTNVGGATAFPAPYCGRRVLWSCEAPRDGTGPSDLSAMPWGGQDTNATFRAGWGVRTGPHPVTARCEHGCCEEVGTVEIDSVTRIGLDVTGADGKGGPDGDLDDAGDSLSGYLPGEVPAGPVIRWDKEENRLVPQRLSLRVETQGPVPYTGVVFRISNVTSKPGWCTNTRDPGDKDPDDAVANWDPNDFSLSETGYLAETNVVFEGSSASVDLFCRDYGGKCRAYVDLLTTNGSNVVRDFYIPPDTDNDGIADHWEADQVAAWNVAYSTNEVFRPEFFGAFGGRPELPDPDGPGPLAAHASEDDWIGADDEYRGVALPSHPLKANPVHRRLSPSRKEILVEAQVARGGGTNAAVVAYAMHAMEAAEGSFRDTLGIDLLWYVGGLDFQFEVDPASYSNTVDRAARRLKAESPLQAARDRVRCVVFGGSVFASKPELLGTTYQSSTVAVGLGNIQAARAGTVPSVLCRFMQNAGIGLRSFVDAVVVHEIGHTVDAGQRGAVDAVVWTAHPVLTVRAKPSYEPGADIEWSLTAGTGLPTSLNLRISKTPYTPVGVTNAFEFTVLGAGAWPTVGALRDALNAHGGFVAECAEADAGRRACTLKTGVFAVPRDGAGLGLRAEADVNGIMTYNQLVADRYANPRFHNGATAGDPPDAALLPSEAAAVNVGPVSR